MNGVIAYHLILTTYGFWLPNDPRGSWSDTVRAFELLQFGHATKVNTQRSVAAKRHDHQLRRQAKEHLAREPVSFTGIQALSVANGFGEYIRKSGLIVRAGVVMRDHAHLVTMRHRYSIEQIGNLLKGSATRSLTANGLHPFANFAYRNGDIPTPWSRGQWAVYLNNDADIDRAVDYVYKNPIKQGMKSQHWPWITV